MADELRRKRYRVTLHNPAALPATLGHARPSAASYKGEASTKSRAFKRAVAASNEAFLTAGQDYCAIACFAFDMAAHMARIKPMGPGDGHRITWEGFTVEIERLR